MTTVQIATIPNRLESLVKTIDSLIDQVDVINIMLNGYSSDDLSRLGVICMKSEKIMFTILDNSTGDAAKFNKAEDKTGYVFTCDDDLIYPIDYIHTMQAAVDRYGGRAIVSLHGRELREGVISSYYAPSNRLQAFHCLGDVPADHVIKNGAIGTGVMAWNADKVKIYYDWFKKPNMADIWLSINARLLGIPLVVIAHREGWLLPGLDTEDTIWHKSFNNDGLQTSIWNEQFRK